MSNRSGKKSMPAPPVHEKPEVKDNSSMPDMPPLEPKVELVGDKKEGVTKLEPVNQGIMVRAIKVGFYRQFRKKVGDEFLISGLDKLGAWMECVDPNLEKKHQEAMAEKKRKSRGL